MEVKFYILGAEDPFGPWHLMEGPFDEYPDLGCWCPSEYRYQYYKIEKVWEFPF